MASQKDCTFGVAIIEKIASKSYPILEKNISKTRYISPKCKNSCICHHTRIYIGMLVVEYVAIFLASVAVVTLICWVSGVRRNHIYLVISSCMIGGLLCIVEWAVGRTIEKSTIICSGLLGLFGNLLCNMR